MCVCVCVEGGGDREHKTKGAKIIKYIYIEREREGGGVGESGGDIHTQMKIIKTLRDTFIQSTIHKNRSYLNSGSPKCHKTSIVWF